MEKYSVKELHQTEIEDIWNKEVYQCIDILKRGYAIHDIIEKDSLLFIGINPSFSGNPEPISHFINLDENEKLYPYFKRFKDIAIETGLSWAHYDLLFFRETKQSFIRDLLKENFGVNFLHSQLQLSKRIIINAKPRIIVVSNTMARHFMGFDKNTQKNTGVWMDFDFNFDEDLGTFKITNTELKGVPVFFTSMLTGQRALDNGSYQRLIWHIKFVNKNIRPATNSRLAQ